MHNDKCQHQLGVGDATKFGFNPILIIIIIIMARITDINTENILLSLLTTNQCIIICQTCSIYFYYSLLMT